MIRFYTSGVIGTDLLWERLQREYPHAITYPTWENFHMAAGQMHWPDYTMSNSNLLIKLLPEYPTDDLKTATDDSPLFKAHLATLNHLGSLFAADRHRQFIFVGHEHGLGFVPMVKRHREQIRRETALAAAVTAHASSYQIMFPGENFLTVFARS